MTEAMTLDADVLARIRLYELQARQIVEGFITGGHRSKQHGFAVEFAQHREYVPGDDIRHIDWKVVGRKERFYLKQYELETNLLCWLLVDASESMQYRSAERSKYDTAAIAATALGYLIVQQNDTLGFATFDDAIRGYLRPSGSPGQVQDALRILGQGPRDKQSSIGPVLHEAANRFKRRGLIAIFSDFFDDPDQILEALRHFRHDRHDVVVFHVLDDAEIDFPFRQSTMFQGLEQLPELLTDPVGVREGYLQEFNAHREALKLGCRALGVDYIELRTGCNLGLTLAEYLNGR